MLDDKFKESADSICFNLSITRVINLLENRESPLNLENSVKEVINYFETCLSAYEYVTTGKFDGGFLANLSALTNLNKLYKTYHELPELKGHEQLSSKVRSYLNILKNGDCSNTEEKSELILVCKSLKKNEDNLFFRLNLHLAYQI